MRDQSQPELPPTDSIFDDFRVDTYLEMRTLLDVN